MIGRQKEEKSGAGRPAVSSQMAVSRDLVKGAARELKLLASNARQDSIMKYCNLKWQ